MADERAYVRPYRSETERRRRSDRWLHDYNHRRSHSDLGARPPIDAVNNLAGHSI